jgi:hypothetical protein
MKSFFYYLVHFFVFIYSITTAFFYAFLERIDRQVTDNVVYKYRLLNSLSYFSALIFAIWLLKFSRNKQRDFKLICIWYGVASLIFDVPVVQILGGLLIVTAIVKLYFSLFPKEGQSSF